jgi:DNA-binding NtrC family response regulator
MDGVELLKRAKAADQEVEVILITGHGTVEVAVEAIKEGAYDFITKPIKKAQLLHAVEKASEKQFLQRENRQLRSQLSQTGAKRFVFSSAEMRDIARMIEQVAPSTATVLVTGESGTFPKPFSKPNSSDMRKAHLPEPPRARKDASNWPTAAHCFLTKSARSPPPCR